MFRRREDETNDASASAQGSLLSGSETVKVLVPETPAYAAAPPAAYTPPVAPSYPTAAPRAQMQDTPIRPITSSVAGNFRSSQPQADISRLRVAEPKPSSAFGNSSLQNTSVNRADSRRVLTVGSDILLKGEIATCDRLVIEGKVDAVLNDVGTVELAETGSFKGIASVENAEISGLFEGELVVKGRLVIYSSGRVRGKITYGEIEIERGGELTGDIKTMASGAQARTTRAPAMKEEKEKAVA